MNKDPDPMKAEMTERQYQNIFDAINDGLVISDLESERVVLANSAACKMHGYPKEEFIGKQLTSFIQADCLKEFNKCFLGFHSEDVLDLEVKHIRRDGSTFYAEWRGTELVFGGQPCLLSIIRDVSSRIHEEQSLRHVVKIHTHEQATLLEISHILASTLELQPGLILDQLREIIEYNTWWTIRIARL